MSEVKRYGICGFEGGVIELKDGHLVHVDDFDRVTAERDAALAELKRYQSLFNQAQKAIDRLNELHPKRMAEIGRRLTAADERADRLELALKFYADGDHLLLADPDAWDTCSGEPVNFLHDDAGTASVEDGSIAKAALKPAEGTDYRKSCEAAHKALSMENQRITPVRTETREDAIERLFGRFGDGE